MQLPKRPLEDRGLRPRWNAKESRERQCSAVQEWKLFKELISCQTSLKNQDWSQNFSKRDCTSKGQSLRHWEDPGLRPTHKSWPGDIDRPHSIHSILSYCRLNMKTNIIFMPLFCRTACRHAARPLSIPKSNELFHHRISAIFDSRNACSMPGNVRITQCLYGDTLHRGHIYSFCLKVSSQSSDLFLVLSLDTRSWSWFCDNQPWIFSNE